MSSSVRVGDPDSDGDSLVQGSRNVLVNGRPKSRIGDIDSDGPPNSLVQGSPNVLTNGVPPSRVGDVAPLLIVI